MKNGDTVELYAVWSTSGFDFKIESMGFFVSANITKYSGNAKDVIIPSYFSGEYSSGIASCNISSISSGVFEGHTEIQTIKNLQTNNINSKVFYGCTSLKTIEMGKNKKINSIGDQAFYNCLSLETLELGETRIIGQEAFYMCTSLNKIVIPRLVESIGASAFYGWDENQTIEFLGHSENVFGEEWLNGCNANIIWAK